MACLHLIDGGLEINGIILIGLAVQSHSGISGVRIKTGAGVAEIHPAAGNDLIGYIAGFQLREVIVGETAAHPGAALGQRGLGNIAAGGIESGEGLAFGRDIHQHGADHQRVTLPDGCPIVIGIFSQSAEVHRNGTLDGRVLFNRLGIHHTAAGGTGGELALPVLGGHANGIVIAVDGSGLAVCIGLENHAAGSVPTVVGIPDVGIMAALGGNGGHVLSAVFNAVQVVAEPAVQDLVIAGIADIKHQIACGIGRSQMSVLMQQELHVLTGFGESVVHQLELLGANVVVVQAVNDQRGAVDLRRAGGADGAFLSGIHRVVADIPVAAGLAVVAIQISLNIVNGLKVVAVIRFDFVPIIGIQLSAGAVTGQCVGVSRLAVGGNALRVGVLIPAGDTGHGNNGLQTGHTGGSQTELGGTGIGTAGHAHLFVGPVGCNGNVAGLIGIGHPVAVEPLDDALEGVDLQIGTAGFIALGAFGTQTAALYHSVAANQIVVIPVQILVVHHLLFRIPVIPVSGICGSSGLFRSGGTDGLARGRRIVHGLNVEIAGIVQVILIAVKLRAAGDVGTGLVDGSSLVVALRSSAGHLHQSLHQIQLAVTVGIVVGLHIDAVTDDVAVLIAVSLFHSAGGKGEDGLGHAVDEQRLMCAAVLHSALQRLIAIAVHQFGQEFLRADLVCIVLILVQHSKAVGQSHTVGIAAQLAVIHASGLEQHPQSLTQIHGCIVCGVLHAVGGEVRIGHGGVAVRFPDGVCRCGNRQGQRRRQQERQKSLSDHAYITFFLFQFYRFTGQSRV